VAGAAAGSPRGPAALHAGGQGHARVQPVPGGLAGPAQAAGTRAGGGRPGPPGQPPRHQRDVRRRPERRRGAAERLHPVRRLRFRLQLRREEHRLDELPARRVRARGAHLHPGGRAVGAPLPGQVAGGLRRARRLGRRLAPVRHRRRRGARGRDAGVDPDPAPVPGPGTAGLGPARARVLEQRRRAGVRLRHRPPRARGRPGHARPDGGHGRRAHDHRPDRPARPGHGPGRRADHRGRLHPRRARLGGSPGAERRVRGGSRERREAAAGTRRDPVRLLPRPDRPHPDLPGHEHRRRRRADRPGERPGPGHLARRRRAARLRGRQPGPGHGHRGAAREGNPGPALGLDARPVADHRAPPRRVPDGRRRGRGRGRPQGPGVRPGQRRCA